MNYTERLQRYFTLRHRMGRIDAHIKKCAPHDQRQRLRLVQINVQILEEMYKILTEV